MSNRMISKDPSYLKRQGANFLALMNDLKRNRRATAEELGIPLSQLEQIISGETVLPEEVIERATQIWPVNRRDFMVLEDDAPEGILIMRKEESQKSSRVFARGGSDYYEYRDTAMSKVSSFRPEWILELCKIEDDNPDNPLIQWNNGHFLHQFTLFIGPVNFYYLDEGKKKVFKANTGDSMYITPFVPHTFATRHRDSVDHYHGQEGLILALTYGNQLAGDAQQELSVLGPKLVSGYLLDTSSREKYFASLLRQQMASLSMSAEDLAAFSSLEAKVMTQFLEGEKLPTLAQYQRLADVLKVNSRDLMPPDYLDERVIIHPIKSSKPRRYQNYQITDLASVRFLPHSKALILDVESEASDLNLIVPLHQYCYNFGPACCVVQWNGGQSAEGRQEVILRPDDSLYIKPHIPHSFSVPAGSLGRILSLRIAGRITGEAQRELSQINPHHLRRLCEENVLWYRER